MQNKFGDLEVRNMICFDDQGTRIGIRERNMLLHNAISSSRIPEVMMAICEKSKNNAKNYQKILLHNLRYKLSFYEITMFFLGTYYSEQLTPLSLRDKYLPPILCKYL